MPGPEINQHGAAVPFTTPESVARQSIKHGTISNALGDFSIADIGHTLFGSTLRRRNAVRTTSLICADENGT
jgi:hypothetical protein